MILQWTQTREFVFDPEKLKETFSEEYELYVLSGQQTEEGFIKETVYELIGDLSNAECDHYNGELVVAKRGDYYETEWLNDDGSWNSNY